MTFVLLWSMVFFGVGLYQEAVRPNAAAEQVMRAFLAQTTFIALLAAGVLAGSGVRTQTFAETTEASTEELRNSGSSSEFLSS